MMCACVWAARAGCEGNRSITASLNQLLYCSCSPTYGTCTERYVKENVNKGETLLFLWYEPVHIIIVQNAFARFTPWVL